MKTFAEGGSLAEDPVEVDKIVSANACIPGVYSVFCRPFFMLGMQKNRVIYQKRYDDRSQVYFFCMQNGEMY